MKKSCGVFPIPTSYFGISLGLFSTGLAYKYASKAIGISIEISKVLLYSASIIWIMLIFVYLYKALFRRDIAYSELKNPIQGCFVSLVPITTILFGISIIDINRDVSVFFIFTGIIIQLIFSSYHTGGMWRGTHTLVETTPVIYLPTIAASFASTIGLGDIGYINLGKIFFGAGLFSWISLEAIVLHRMRVDEMNSSLRPIVGIQLAPAFVACAAYLSINGGKVDTFALMLIGYGLLNLFFLIRLSSWVFENGFTTSFWAYSFGLGSMANSGAHMYAQLKGDIVSTIGLFMFIFASLLILVLIFFTIRLIFKGKFILK